MYRSGDMGRRKKNGSIQFLGRTDEQIQIRATVSNAARSEAA